MSSRRDFVKQSAILGTGIALAPQLTFGSNLNLDDIWNKLFIKFTNVLNLWNARKLSYKGESTVLNSVAISKFLYYVTCGIMPKHYITLFQKESLKRLR